MIAKTLPWSLDRSKGSDRMHTSIARLDVIRFLFMGKQKVYQNYHNDLDELRTSITNVIQSIQLDVLMTVFSNISKSLNLVVQNKGVHTEQYLRYNPLTSGT